MTDKVEQYVGPLTEKCREVLGDESEWITADGYPNSLALCMIDAIYSTGSHYTSVRNVVSAYCTYRESKGGNAYTDGPDELLETFSCLGGSDQWATEMGNRKPAHTRPNALLKAEVIRQAAEACKEMGLRTPADLSTWLAPDADYAPLKSLWTKLPSQSSGVTFNYLAILAGYQSVKPDRMIIRFVEEHTSMAAGDASPMEIAELLRQVAKQYPTQVRKLDHVIWRLTSGRAHLITTPDDHPAASIHYVPAESAAK